MRFANIVKKISVVIVAVWQLFIASAYAGEVVGKVTAVDYAAGSVVINGVRYLFPATATKNQSVDTKGVKDISGLRYGQIVSYSADKGVIARISILPGAREIPQ